MFNKFKNNFFMTLIAIYIVLFFGPMIMGISTSEIYQIFGVQKNLVLDYGEFYRIITYGFFHSDIFHIGFNALALYYIAPIVINFTSKKFTYIVYFIALIVSGIGIVFFSNSIAIGASGAIMGLFGILIFYAIKAAKAGYNDLLRGLMPVIIINVMISLMPGISLSGHLFGIITGIIASVIYDKYIRNKR